ncbi:hypothetical protein OS493_034380 [Desmophyllum pertusum]|uniref:Uncharacterized protein n=1 Tax=Desmophyllum pertusum TaxID=174260 RepID=A0A9X0D745_9CNID|nr:hypothetical protein OS493_034380 [Desmophyllum pertusum]
MSYSAKTAQRSYVRTNLTRLGAEALDIIARVTSVRSAVADEETGESEPSADADVRTAVAHQPTGEPSADADICTADADEATAASESSVSCTVSLVSSVLIPPTPQKPLTEKQKEAVRTIFDADIKQQKNLSFKDVRARCCTSSCDMSIVEGKADMHNDLNLSCSVGPAMACNTNSLQSRLFTDGLLIADGSLSNPPETTAGNMTPLQHVVPSKTSIPTSTTLVVSMPPTL